MAKRLRPPRKKKTAGPANVAVVSAPSAAPQRKEKVPFMKRSHAIALGATGIILAGAWLGSGSSQRIDDRAAGADTPETAQIYDNVEDCRQSRKPLFGDRNADGTLKVTEEQNACEREFQQAMANHVSTAPKFSNQNACESEYGSGKCQSTTFNGAAVFIPALAGFMVARYLTSQRNAQPLLPARVHPAGQCPPGQTPETMPGCSAPPRTGSSSSSGSGGSGSGWRSYSTSSGHTVSRNGNAPTATIPSSAGFAPAPRTSMGAAPARSSSYSTASSSSSVSRGGFGSSGRSSSSS